MNFQTIQEFYELGLWDASQIAQLVQGGVLTPVQYQEIVGQAYPVVEKQPVVSTKPVTEGLKPKETDHIKEGTTVESKAAGNESIHAGVAQG